MNGSTGQAPSRGAGLSQDARKSCSWQRQLLVLQWQQQIEEATLTLLCYGTSKIQFFNASHCTM
jgi:hypothetical protein